MGVGHMDSMGTGLFNTINSSRFLTCASLTQHASYLLYFQEGVAPDRSYHRPGNIGTIVDLALHMESQTELGALGFAQLAEDEAWRGMVTGPLAEEKRLQALELGQAVPSALAGLNMGDTSSSDEASPCQREGQGCRGL